MKWYVIFNGKNEGVYDNWNECRQYVIGIKGVRYRSFLSEELAHAALKLSQTIALNLEMPTVGICSDASYLVSKNILEYQVVDIGTGERVYHSRFNNTIGKHLTNLGEFFGLIRAVKYVIDNDLDLPIYSDSRTAIEWVTNKRVNTLQSEAFWLDKVNAGLGYLKGIKLPIIHKWHTDLWGEIPADFGRK